MKILHFSKDDKFIDSSIKIWDALDDKSIIHEFLCISFSDEFKYVKSEKVKPIKNAVFNSCYMEKYLSQYDFIFIHSLTALHCHLINSHPKCRFVWIGMGFDYYDLLSDKTGSLYSKKTLKLLSSCIGKKNKKTRYFFKSLLKIISLKKISRFNNVLEFFGFFYYKLKCIFSSSIAMKKNAIKKITYFAPVLKSEFFLVNEVFPHLKFLDWNYAASSFSLGGYEIDDLSHNILLGNSSDPRNNHIDVLDLLNDIGFGGRVFMPLSYGNMNYSLKLRKEFEKYDLDIKSLDDFMSQSEYFSLLKSCQFVIMNHVRQQAGSNIAVMLHMGAKVFLNDHSPFLSYYRDKGAFVYSLSELESNPSLLLEGLDSSKRIMNKKIIDELKSIESSKKQYAALLEKIKNNLLK